LLKANSGLRVRTEEGLEGTTPRPGLLTYKGPPLAQPLSPREAFDVTVEPAEQMVAMILALGFVPTLSYEKVRESWEVEGCKVELDRMPAMGLFVEVEGPSEQAVRDARRASCPPSGDPRTAVQ
jgi:predicted adenylyl cyclase CyaB